MSFVRHGGIFLLLLIATGCSDEVVSPTTKPQFQYEPYCWDPSRTKTEAQCSQLSTDQRNALNLTYGTWLAHFGGAKTHPCSRILAGFFTSSHWVFNNYNFAGGAGGWSYVQGPIDWNGLNFTPAYQNSFGWHSTFFHELYHQQWYREMGRGPTAAEYAQFEADAYFFGDFCASGGEL